MRIKYDDMAVAVDRLKAVITDTKNEQVAVLIRLNKENGTGLIAYSDGKRAICSKIPVAFDEAEVIDDNIIVSFKQLSSMMDSAKPVGTLTVENIDMFIDTAVKQIKFSVEKVVYVPGIPVEGSDEAPEEEAIHISTINVAFKYNRAEDDRRQAALLMPKYDEMLSIHEADLDADSVSPDMWNRAELISVLGKVTTEDGQQVLMSGKTHSVSVKNLNYAVVIPHDEINKSACIDVKVAKNIADVFKKVNSENVGMLPAEGFCTVCDENGTVAFWFDAGKPLRRVVDTIDGYKSLQYDKFQIIVLKDGILNIAECCTDAKDVKLSFKKNSLGNNVVIGVNGNDTSSKSSSFELSATAVYGIIDELCALNISVNTETFKSMLKLCNNAYIALDIDLGDGSSTNMRISDVSHDGDEIVRELCSYTTVISSNK